MHNIKLLCAMLGLSFFLASFGVQAKEYMVVGARPDKLFVIDIKARKVEKSFTIPDSTGPQTIVTSPDGKVAYVGTNSLRSIVGIDLDNGDVVFRADLDYKEDERTWNYGFDISPDGSEIYSYDIPTRIHTDRYESLEPRLSVFKTDAGLDAKPVREFPMPRRIHLLMTAKSGALYAMGWDFYKIDVQTGKTEVAYPLRNWTQENLSQPDALAFWPSWDNNGIFSTPITYVRTDMAEDNMERYRTGLLSFDLGTEKFELTDFQSAPEVLFSSVFHPDRKTAYAAYNTLLKIDLQKPHTEKRIDLDHTYYQTDISADGTEVYVGGTTCDIAIYDAKDLSRRGEVILPGCPDMGATVMRMIHK
ncbi:quinohemoprotein amine dehydrogenase subunit beta [Paremcibacter congregatus]|uniref:quinohemoprotein amine dehydrogenase subunit beta n=1 Tax=Paremcibacter congregatus TaxID=2043170 RepID=UPI0030EBDE9C|tara:strand:+ start:189 stop:1271 length:1083 start_codon:yes stop_codon:yes gene_type:complete